MLVLNLNDIFLCSIEELELKSVKLGNDGTGEENPAKLDSLQLLKGKPPDAGQKLTLYTRKPEKDDFYVNAGDCHSSTSPAVGEPYLS